jgi:hypothetical protein
MRPVKATANSFHRVQIDLTAHKFEECKKLETDLELRTHAELFENAMSLFKWAVDQVREGREIRLYDPKTGQSGPVHFPVLENAARRALARKPLTLVEGSQHD